MEKTLKNINEEFEKFLNQINRENFDKNKVKEAYNFAKKAHAFQERKTGEPYIIHPLEVAKIVYDFGLDETSVISALLHDVIEDTEKNLEDIGKNFGNDVKNIVEGLTKIEMFGVSKEERNIEALRKVLLSSAKDIRIILIKLCDRLHNMRTLKDLDEDKQNRISNETLKIYVPIAQKIGVYALKWELEDLALKYQNPSMYQYIKNKLGLKRVEREAIVSKAVEELKDILIKNNIKDVKILGRPKNFYSIYKKIKNKARDFNDIYDLYAVRIITKSIPECYVILGILHENLRPFPDRLKDYIANPKSNDYQSIHTLLFSKSINFPIEVQIRTENMHKLAEFGVAAHWRYKNLKEDKKFEKRISWLRELIQWEKEHNDNSMEFLNLLKVDFFEDEIFVFTPRNDIINLPEKSTALDFAYAVHTEIGNKAYKSKVNGFMSTLDKELKSGDIVEIITNSKSKPNERWLKIVKSTKAKLKIRDALKLKFKGNVRVKNVESSFEELKKGITRLDEFKKSRKAKCCKIEYGDQLTGVYKDKKEIVIHNASCENAKYTLHKKIPLFWKDVKKKEIYLTLILKDRFGLLIDILNIFNEYNLPVSSLNTKINKDGSVKMTLYVADGPHIDNLMKSLNKLELVEPVKIWRGLFS
jgi:guanosine-3',5'-bis(diphosphate) 3'-pyrophosphohydrolase